LWFRDTSLKSGEYWGGGKTVCTKIIISTFVCFLLLVKLKVLDLFGKRWCSALWLPMNDNNNMDGNLPHSMWSALAGIPIVSPEWIQASCGEQNTGTVPKPKTSTCSLPTKMETIHNSGDAPTMVWSSWHQCSWACPPNNTTRICQNRPTVALDRTCRQFKVQSQSIFEHNFSHLSRIESLVVLLLVWMTSS
jgi:hypothetical protein